MTDTPGFEPLDKDTFEAAETVLRTALLDAQFDYAAKKSRTLVILVNGPDGSGKGEIVNRLNEWLDLRGLTTRAYDINKKSAGGSLTTRRYWSDLPGYGGISVLLGSWYHQIMLMRAKARLSRAGLSDALERVDRTEKMLLRDGVDIVKIWLDLSAEQAAREFRRKRREPGGPKHPLICEWSEVKGQQERRRLVHAADELISSEKNSSQEWHRVPASDPRARDLAVGNIVLNALSKANADRAQAEKKPAIAGRITQGPSVLSTLDLSCALEKDEYSERLQVAQERLYNLTRRKKFRKRGLILAFEGNDAAGKGGAIRRVRAALDPVQTWVHPVAAPDSTDLAHPYLWRFWRRIPDYGDIAIFDRSWYGRVLVERVEGFAAQADWSRAYGEINDFEASLGNSGFIVQKFWLAIDADEQLARFEARRETPHKHFKITDDDWRNREKWPEYEVAVEDMLALTSTRAAPWTLVEANNKRWSRVKIIETIVRRLEDEL